MAEGGEERRPEDDPELEKRLKELEDEGNAIAQRIQANVSNELNSHLAKLEEEFRVAFDDRIKMVTSAHKTQASDEMTRKQTDILRTNKVFREISRPLGDKWKPVFEILISDLPTDQKRAELQKVEIEKPFMQPYKSLMTWKEVRGDAFDVRELVSALRFVGLDELAQKTLSILDTGDKDSLISFTDGAKQKALSGPSAGQAKAPTAMSSTAATAAAGGSGDNSQKRTAVNAEEVLDDRHLLQMAKKLGGEWESLAKKLNVPGGEIAEIIESEGKTYQGAFKMLWNWRKSATNLSEALENLIAQLRAVNRPDIVELLH